MEYCKLMIEKGAGAEAERILPLKLDEPGMSGIYQYLIKNQVPLEPGQKLFCCKE